jgi:hypothetical protein
MTPETRKLYERWQQLANAEPPRRAEHITAANKRWERIRAAKDRFESALLADKVAARLSR